MAKISIEKAVEKLSGELDEVEIFVKEFLPPYSDTLDEM